MRVMNRQAACAAMACVSLTMAGLAGCQQPAEEQGGGGGASPAATSRAPGSSPNVQATREHLGNAYVQAARVHAEVAANDYESAEGAIRELRGELTNAKRAARIETQAQINRLDQAAIRVQRDVQNRSLNAYESANQLVDQVQGLFASMTSPQGPGGGAGAGSPLPTPMDEASPELEPAPGGTPGQPSPGALDS